MAKYNTKKSKVLKQTCEFSIKIFCWEWEGENISKGFFIYKQLDKCQNEYYPDNINSVSFCRRISLHVIIFPISLLKRNMWSYWKWLTFEGNIWSFFIRSNKNRNLFSF